MTNKLTDNSNDHSYFVLTPQIVWAFCQDPYEYTLWNVIKMIAGEGGECFLATPDLAAAAMMSAGKVSECRKRLIESGLIIGDFRRDPGYPQPVWHLTVPDLWAQNLQWREENADLLGRIEIKREQRKSLHPVKPSPREEGIAPGDRGITPGETKKNHIEPKEEPADLFLAGDPKEEPATTDKPITEFKDYLSMSAEVHRRTGGKPSPTIPAAAGGADPYLDGPLTAACAILRITPEVLDEKQQRSYAAKIREIVDDIQGGTPEMFVKACKMWGKHGPAWKGKESAPYPDVFVKGFELDMSNLMRQILSGSVGAGKIVRIRN